mmetsp:Transcript_44573/g.113908  ORF Transcript_44573/g.113908 Transcript_44573/m.113908 type:complete len:708 (-) Transcript_44573:7-2130(-)
MGTRCRHTGRRLATSWGLAWQRGADCQGRSAASHGGDCARRRRVCPEMRESGGRKGVGEGANASSNVPSSVATIRVPWACFILGRPAGTAQGPGGHSLALEVAVVDRGKLELGVHLAACKPTAMQRGLGLLRALQGAKLQVHKALALLVHVVVQDRPKLRALLLDILANLNVPIWLRLSFGVKHVLQQQARRRNGRRRPQHALHVRQRVRGGSGRRRGHGGLRRGHAGGRSTAGHVVGAREAGHQLRARRAGHLQAMAIVFVQIIDGGCSLLTTLHPKHSGHPRHAWNWRRTWEGHAWHPWHTWGAGQWLRAGHAGHARRGGQHGGDCDLDVLACDVQVVQLLHRLERVAHGAVLHKAGAGGRAGVVLGDSGVVQRTKGRKDALKVGVPDVGMDVADCQLARTRVEVHSRRHAGHPMHAAHAAHACRRVLLRLCRLLVGLPRHVLLRLRGLHHDGLPVERLPGERQRVADLQLVRHLDVGKALGALGVAVGNDADVCDGARLGEELEDVAVVRLGVHVVRKHRARVALQRLQLALRLALRAHLWRCALPPGGRFSALAGAGPPPRALAVATVAAVPVAALVPGAVAAAAPAAVPPAAAAVPAAAAAALAALLLALPPPLLLVALLLLLLVSVLLAALRLLTAALLLWLLLDLLLKVIVLVEVCHRGGGRGLHCSPAIPDHSLASKFRKRCPVLLMWRWLQCRCDAAT